ncbi:efflux RND transporter permease subunit [Cupriavidus basilensis]
MIRSLRDAGHVAGPEPVHPGRDPCDSGPVMMTATVAMLGLMPVPVRHRARARKCSVRWRWSMIGGLITSTLLTLVMVPTLYRLVR